jgi:hypothetical protein
MQLPVPHVVTDDSSSRHNAAWENFSAAPHYECINAYISPVDHSYSVVQPYDPSADWNQNLLLQEQKPSGVEKKSNVTMWRTSLSNPHSIYVYIRTD